MNRFSPSLSSDARPTASVPVPKFRTRLFSRYVYSLASCRSPPRGALIVSETRFYAGRLPMLSNHWWSRKVSLGPGQQDDLQTRLQIADQFGFFAPESRGPGLSIDAVICRRTRRSKKGGLVRSEGNHDFD